MGCGGHYTLHRIRKISFSAKVMDQDSNAGMQEMCNLGINHCRKPPAEMLGTRERVIEIHPVAPNQL